MASPKYDGHEYPHSEPNLAFTRAVLAFQNNKKPKPVAKVEVVESKESEPLNAHEERHKKRIRLARGIQHLLTGILSLVVAILQGTIYVRYVQTKDMKDAWPAQPNLLPTLMLFGTAVAGIVFDTAALIAYALPQTSFGKKALALAIRANTMITTIKTTAYGFSTVVCRSGFDLGNATNMNNDLWSWSCRAKGGNMSSVINADFNCTGNTVAWGLSIASIVIQFIGIVIDQVVAADAKKFAKKTDTEDSKPLLADAASSGKNDEYDELEKITNDYDSQLQGQLPTETKTK